MAVVVLLVYRDISEVLLSSQPRNALFWSYLLRIRLLLRKSILKVCHHRRGDTTNFTQHSLYRILCSQNHSGKPYVCTKSRCSNCYCRCPAQSLTLTASHCKRVASLSLMPTRKKHNEASAVAAQQRRGKRRGRADLMIDWLACCCCCWLAEGYSTYAVWLLPLALLLLSCIL